MGVTMGKGKGGRKEAVVTPRYEPGLIVVFLYRTIRAKRSSYYPEDWLYLFIFTCFIRH